MNPLGNDGFRVGMTLFRAPGIRFPSSWPDLAEQFRAEQIGGTNRGQIPIKSCQQPGVSIAALAGQHGMNANVLHRWLKERQPSACQPLMAQPMPATLEVPAFVPVPLSAPMPEHRDHEIRVELRKGALTMVVSWPMRAAADLASWTAAVLK